MCFDTIFAILERGADGEEMHSLRGQIGLLGSSDDAISRAMSISLLLKSSGKVIKTSLVAQSVKNLPCNAGEPGLIPGSGRSLGEGNGNTLQYSCLVNTMDRGAQWAAVHGVTRVRHDLVTKAPR